MPVKRAANRGRVRGESSSAAQGREGRSKRTHDPQPAQTSKFRSQGHKNLYETQTKKRTIIPERPLACVNSVFDSLPLPPSARGWDRFLSHPSLACKNMVREFYANGRDLPGSRNLPKGETYVRGFQVIFDSHTINSIFGIPPQPEGEICYYDAMMKGHFDPDEVIQELCIPGARWTEKVNGDIKGLLRKDLKPLPLEFLHFILASIHPSKHGHEVTRERIYILYNMMKGRYMDLGRILADELAKAVESSRAITCPSLVFKLCLHAGVQGNIEEDLHPGPMLGVKFVQRRSTAFSSMPPQQMSDESETEYRERCTAANDVPPPSTSESRVLAALARNERKIDRLTRFMRYIGSEVRSIKKKLGIRSRTRSPPGLSSSSQAEEEGASAEEGTEEQRGEEEAASSGSESGGDEESSE